MVKIPKTWIEQDLPAKRGDTFSFALEWPADIDLDDYAFTFKYQDTPGIAAIVLTEGSGITVVGQIVTVEIDSATTAGWDWSGGCASFEYSYVKNGKTTTFIVGKIKIPEKTL